MNQSKENWQRNITLLYSKKVNYPFKNSIYRSNSTTKRILTAARPFDNKSNFSRVAKIDKEIKKNDKCMTANHYAMNTEKELEDTTIKFQDTSTLIKGKNDKANEEPYVITMKNISSYENSPKKLQNLLVKRRSINSLNDLANKNSYEIVGATEKISDKASKSCKQNFYKANYSIDGVELIQIPPRIEDQKNYTSIGYQSFLYTQSKRDKEFSTKDPMILNRNIANRTDFEPKSRK